MENKRKKMFILILLIIVVVIAIVTCILIFAKPNNKQNKPNDNPIQSGENNKPNTDNDNTDDKDNSDNEDNTENNDDNNSNDDNSNGSGDNNQGGTTTPTVKKLRIYSCRRTTNENDVEIVDSLSLKYHIEDGLQSDEVIVTIRPISEAGSATLDAYKKWMEELKAIKGITVTTTQSGDKTVFRIKTDYKKVDYSNIDFNDENRVMFYNEIRANDTLETITEFLNEAGYTCQPPKEA